MILVDTSAWVEYLRGTGSATHERVRRAIEDGEPLATTDPVIMELLAGAGAPPRPTELRRFLTSFDHVPTEGLADYEMAAAIYRRCREAGATVRSLTDCLIGVVAIRAEVPVLACDRDYEAIAGVTSMALAD